MNDFDRNSGLTRPGNHAIRCSKLDLLAACAAAGAPQEWTSAGNRGAADLGSAGHFIWTTGIAGEVAEVHDAAAKFQVDPDDLRELMDRFAWPAWRSVLSYFPQPMTEAYYEWTAPDGHKLTGHIDVLDLSNPHEARITDGKSGRLDMPHDNQVKGYAWLVLQNHPELCQVRTCILRWRHRVADWAVYTRAGLEAWWDWMSGHLQDQTIFSPGPHCGYCPRGATCPAKTALLQQACALLTAGKFSLPADPLARAQVLLEVKERVKLLRDGLDQAHELVKAEVRAAGGIMDLGDGRALVLRDEKRRAINVRLGVGILQEALGPARLLEMLKISKGDVEAAVGAKAGKGQKGKAIKELMDRLDSQGAMTTTITTKLEIKKNVVQVC